jgi:arylsulfatase A-like enzyme
MGRVILVLTDGLRPDAVTTSRMPSLSALADACTQAVHATTVRPSTTVAALATLATGVSPQSHGLIEPGLGFLSRLGRLRPLARELARAGHRSQIVASDFTAVDRSVVWALASAAGVGRFVSRGRRARDVAHCARDAAADQPHGVMFVYLNDCDRAGHAHGWMSPEHLAAAAEVDAAVGVLAPLAERDLVLVLADHGGGGVTPNDHHEPHAVNDAIPLVLAGPDVARGRRLTRPVSILDVPPTVCAWLGMDVPSSYEGRVLSDAFACARRPALVAS